MRSTTMPHATVHRGDSECHRLVAAPSPQSRRRFLTTVAAVGAPWIFGPGCKLDSGEPRPRQVRNPHLVRMGEHMVGIVDPDSAPSTIAYASRASKYIYVDAQHRDLARNLLGAHISVSTGHWRVRAPGDSPLEPLTPGFPDREFEEVELSASRQPPDPMLGDVRVVLGIRPEVVSYQLDCAPWQDGWLNGGPWTVDVCRPTNGATTEERKVACREDLTPIGSARLVGAPCEPDKEERFGTASATEVTVLAWTAWR